MTQFTFDCQHSVKIPSGTVLLDGFLYIPKMAQGLVLFVHGSGSSRFSTRNQYVAKELNKAHLATLLFDLFTPEEDSIDNRTRELRFNIEFLANRLINASLWCSEQNELHDLSMGYFGASTGGGAALVAAASKPNLVHAVVSRGGRPDLANTALPAVQAPTLLIVGGNDDVVIGMNEEALLQLQCIKQMEIVPGATHLFEEPGTLEKVARLAKNWFTLHLRK